MNKKIIIEMIRPYLENQSITYNKFDEIFSFLSKKEQYEVVNLLAQNSIFLRDEDINENQLEVTVDVIEFGFDIVEENEFYIEHTSEEIVDEEENDLLYSESISM